MIVRKHRLGSTFRPTLLLNFSCRTFTKISGRERRGGAIRFPNRHVPQPAPWHGDRNLLGEEAEEDCRDVLDRGVQSRCLTELGGVFVEIFVIKAIQNHAAAERLDDATRKRLRGG